MGKVRGKHVFLGILVALDHTDTSQVYVTMKNDKMSFLEKIS